MLLLQIVTWFVIPAVKNSTAAHNNHTLSLIVLIQYVPRLYVMFPINRRIVKTTGAVAKTAWSGAAYNLLLYMLAGHVSINLFIFPSISLSSCFIFTTIFIFEKLLYDYYCFKLSVQVLGASWYVLSIQRQLECWKIECRKEINTTHSPSCHPLFLDCSTLGKPDRNFWLKTTNVITGCDARNDNFHFGMFADAFTNDVAASNFIDKYFYCLWWGLKNLWYVIFN